MTLWSLKKAISATIVFVVSLVASVAASLLAIFWMWEAMALFVFCLFWLLLSLFYARQTAYFIAFGDFITVRTLFRKYTFDYSDITNWAWVWSDDNRREQKPFEISFATGPAYFSSVVSQESTERLTELLPVLDVIHLVPESPEYIPPADNQMTALFRFLELSATIDDLTVENVADIDLLALRDPSGLFCPNCEHAVPFEFFFNQLEHIRHPDSGAYRLIDCQLPCCGNSCSLNDLWGEFRNRDGHQIAFGRFVISASNTRLKDFRERYLAEFESILDTDLRLIRTPLENRT